MQHSRSKNIFSASGEKENQKNQKKEPKN